MRPAALLVAFCAVMVVVAVGRLAIEWHRDRWIDPVDVGTALLVVGLTLVSMLGVAIIEIQLGTTGLAILETRLGIAGLTVLAITGGVTVCLGLRMLVRYWSDSAANGPRRTDGNDF